MFAVVYCNAPMNVKTQGWGLGRCERFYKNVPLQERIGQIPAFWMIYFPSKAYVKSILLYSFESWAVTKTFIERIDGKYTRLFRAAPNVSWKSHMTNQSFTTVSQGSPQLFVIAASPLLVTLCVMTRWLEKYTCGNLTLNAESIVRH